MDIDKDGTITKNDIRAAFDNVGKLMSEGELDDMLGEVGGACTFDAMIKMFQAKMAGGKIIYFTWVNLHCSAEIKSNLISLSPIKY